MTLLHKTNPYIEVYIFYSHTNTCLSSVRYI